MTFNQEIQQQKEKDLQHIQDQKEIIIRRHVQRWVEKVFNEVPVILFQDLAAHDEPYEILDLVASNRSRCCPHCEEEVELLEGTDDDWVCFNCLETSKYEGPYSKLRIMDVDDWPCLWGTMFWDKDNRINSDKAVECGFEVYEHKKIQGRFLALDHAGYDFYPKHWIPLYKDHKINWHKDDLDWKKMRQIEKELSESV